ncbi:hypothetical protein [Pseudomonas allokribbensis]|uniref:hypothetical protein n=1 Tax=Pseudomonas allokribbensis TaxID=2774460 RepID=UPI001787A008|nr:hypothetical protein [Pseudomonas allokribbensis]
MSKIQHILFVFEGEKTEKLISRKFIEYYFSSNGKSIVTTAFCGEIYQLIAKMKEDGFGLGSIDLFPLLQDMPENKSLKEFKRDDFSETYLFFDYDPHASGASDDKVKELLEFFSEETEEGKLFISYPMAEAVRCMDEKCKINCFSVLSVPLSIGNKFKNFSSIYSSDKFRSVKSWTREHWNEVVWRHCEKSNFIAHGLGLFPAVAISESELFEGQLKEKLRRNRIYVLSSFPMMLASYYGMRKVKEMTIGRWCKKGALRKAPWIGRYNHSA